MSVSQAFDTPLERLGLLPNGMNWRGDWDIDTQYFLNDVVRSPANLSSYILNGKDAYLGGADPSLDPIWVELSAATTGVQQVNAGRGISLDPLGTATNPIIDNDGILTITAGPGIGVVGGGTTGVPPFNATISNNGIISALNGPGISTSTAGGVLTITNNGVRSINQGNGITVDTSVPNVPTIINNGIVGIVSGGTGITATTTANVSTITNTGVLSVNAGTGISVSGPAATPTISTNFTAPLLSNFVISNINTLPAVVPAGGQFILPLGLQGLIATSFGSGVSDPNGTWLINCGNVIFQNISPTSTTATLTLQVQDNFTTAIYTIPIGQGGDSLIGTQTGTAVSLGTFVLPVAAVRAAGLNRLDRLIVTNNTSQDIYLTSLNVSYNAAIYFPLGVQ